jgi:hypothetical protein
MNLYTLKTFFFIGKQRNSIKKKSQPPLNIHGVYKKDTKTKEKQKTKKKHPKKPKRQKIPPALPHKPRALKETWTTLHNSKGPPAFNPARTNTPNNET